MRPPQALHARTLSALVVLLASVYGCGDGGRSVILIADAGNGRIVQMDDFTGAGWIAFAYPSVNKSLLSPGAIAADSHGRIYASSLGDDWISRMDDISGKGFVTLGRPGGGVREFAAPFGLAIDAQDRLYVADSDNGRIVRMDSIDGAGWTSLGRRGRGRNEFDGPADVALDTLGRIYVADRGNHRIVRFDDMSGAGWTTYGHADPQQKVGPGVFDLLGGIAVGSNGLIYVTDVNENVVISIQDMSGAGYAYFGYIPNDSLFKQPTGVWVNGSSPVYVASQNNNHVARFEDIRGTGYRSFGEAGSGVGQLDQPLDVLIARVPQ